MITTIKTKKEFFEKLKNNELYGGSSYCCKRLQDNKEVVLAGIKVYPDSLRKASDRLKDDKEVVLEAMKGRAYVYECVSERLKRDADVINAAIDSEDECWFLPEWIPEGAFTDDMAYKFIAKDSEGIVYAPRHIQEEITNKHLDKPALEGYVYVAHAKFSNPVGFGPNDDYSKILSVATTERKAYDEAIKILSEFGCTFAPYSGPWRENQSKYTFVEDKNRLYFYIDEVKVK